MKVLLDTHIWIWWLLGCERLSIAHRRALDRLIVATAQSHGLPIATHDRAIQASGVIPIWEG